jgi:hypothetical protein
LLRDRRRNACRLITDPRNEAMHAERNEEKFELPQDLVAEMSKRNAPRKQDYYRVEAFKPSFFGRVAEMFGGKRR